ncbi:RNA polymerase sigma-70 factor, ECF subfamily [Catalinimonas alkaloidigena]|uniref:RNA polymerase sigma-70 factor, ECF subfamily n=1 Tax=Catalinimonas alkaloidigena TaxID=1075417 RepID=A0A1G8XEG2_9BACT|nr:RNA polymerase sigma-70 factor [Catalinimonas alkaloidigena]SDJ88787.1 RNA polymerase sigma-70 factor, ECF subfamily [Catalinimonas alkaloidigena]
MKVSGTHQIESLLISRLQAGDKAAFETIYLHYYPQFEAFARFELKNEELARDAVHDVFLTLWSKRASLDPSLSLKSFLYTCLKNRILNLIKAQHNALLRNGQVVEQQLLASHDTELSFGTHEGMQRLSAHLAALPEKRRKIVEMHFFQGLSYPEIAQRVDLSVNTVKMYVSQSARDLKAIIENEI